MEVMTGMVEHEKNRNGSTNWGLLPNLKTIENTGKPGRFVESRSMEI